MARGAAFKIIVSRGAGWLPQKVFIYKLI